jgi:hypothetical protein
MSFNVIVTSGFKKHAKNIAKKHRSLKTDIDYFKTLEPNRLLQNRITYHTMQSCGSGVNPTISDVWDHASPSGSTCQIAMFSLHSLTIHNFLPNIILKFKFCPYICRHNTRSFYG